MLTALVPAAAVASVEREWRFRVTLDGDHVGYHRFRIERDGAEQRVESDARFTVTFLFIEAYRYTHLAKERWRGKCLETIESRTDDNGERTVVRGHQATSAFVVDNGRDRVALPRCVMSFAYWNNAILAQSRLVNAQTGELVEVAVEPLGAETISVRGTPTATRRYALRGSQFRIDVWYSADDSWVQLESRTGGGKALRYLIQ